MKNDQKTEEQLNLELPTNVVNIEETRKEERLRDEFELVRITKPVYVFDAKEAKVRSLGAARIAKFREKQAEKGLTSALVPSAILEKVKEKGGWNEWIDAQKVTTFFEKVVEKEVIREVMKEVARDISVEPAQDKADKMLGKRVRSMPGARGWLVRWLLS